MSVLYLGFCTSVCKNNYGFFSVVTDSHLTGDLVGPINVIISGSVLYQSHKVKRAVRLVILLCKSACYKSYP